MLTTLAIAAAAAAVLLGGFLWLYVKTPANMALVRTGLGGRRIVIDGGALVLPVVQHIQWISLETSKLEVLRREKEAFITKDRFRVDIGAEFYVKVPPDVQAIERASRSLGERSFSADGIKALVEEKLVAALRADAAQRELVELHENRRGFAQAVMETLREALAPNGLALEEVSIFFLDQTPREHLDPNNIFDAEGLRRIAAQTTERIRERNEIERNAEVAIKRKDIEAVKLKLGLDQEREFAEADQRRQVESYRAEREAETAEFRSQQNRRVREAEIHAQQEVREAELRQEAHLIQQAGARDVAEVQKEREVELARRAREIAVAAKERERLEEEARRLEAESRREAAAQQVITTNQRLAAERERELAGIRAQEELEVAARHAEAAKEVAAARIKEGEAEAQVRRARNEAENRLEPRVIRRDVLLHAIDRAPQIVEAMMAPVAKIDSIRIVDLGGARPEGGPASPVSRLASSFLEAGIALPLIKELLRDAKGDPAEWATVLFGEPATKGARPAGEDKPAPG
jgi:flotillin